MRKFGVLVALLGVAACGDDDPARHLDAGMSDAPPMIDAPVVPQPVTLTLSSNGQPLSGVVVHFQNADSSLVSTEMTDATGTASHVMAAGGYVSAVDVYSSQPTGVSQHDVMTFAGVKPGDHLQITDAAFSSATMTVALPVESDANITNYEIHTTCGSVSTGSAGSGSAPTAPISLYGCGATTDVLAVAEDNTGAIVRYIYKADQTVTDQGSIDLTQAAYVAATSRTYTFTNVPAALSTLYVRQYVASAKGNLMSLNVPTTGTTTRTVSYAIPVIPNGIGVVEGSVFSESGSTHMTLDWAPLSATAFTTDLGARMLVDVTTPGFDPAAHAVTWANAAPGVAADFSVVSTRGNRTDANNNVRYLVWQMASPYASGVATYPTLPVGEFDYNWNADDAVNVDTLGLGKVPGGYDAIRAKIFSLNDPTSIITGATGSATFVSSGSNQARKAPEATPRKPLTHRTQR